MKIIITLLALLGLSSHGVERDQIFKLLDAASVAQSADYLEARDAIVALGSNALPALEGVTMDASLEWGPRMVARICRERIVRGGDIQTLLTHDWNAYPPYQGIPPAGQTYMNIMGPHIYMGEYVVPKCKEAGLWYYYLEQNWKKTGEAAQIRPRRDPKFETSWPNWCRKALEGEPEQQYVPMVLMDKLGLATFASRDDVNLYGTVLGMKFPDAVPVLVKKYEGYNKRDINGQEAFPGSHAITFRHGFSPILDFADARHAELLEKYIAEHPALAELKPRLMEVRARPAPPPVPDPPFRLGTNLVVRPNP